MAHGSGEADIRMLQRGWEMLNVVNIAFLILNFGPWSARLLLASWNKISAIIWTLQVFEVAQTFLSSLVTASSLLVATLGGASSSSSSSSRLFLFTKFILLILIVLVNNEVVIQMNENNITTGKI
jgi:hypothetical protein